MHKDELAHRETFLAGIVLKAWAHLELVDDESAWGCVSMRFAHPEHVLPNELPLAPHGGANAELRLMDWGSRVLHIITPRTVALGIRAIREAGRDLAPDLAERLGDARHDNVTDDLSLLDAWFIVLEGVQVQERQEREEQAC